MTSSQPEVTRHPLIEFFLEGLRDLRIFIPKDALDQSTRAAIDAWIEKLSTLEGMRVSVPPIRALALAEGLRVAAEQLLPYVDKQRVDLAPLVGILSGIERELRQTQEAGSQPD